MFRLLRRSAPPSARDPHDALNTAAADFEAIASGHETDLQALEMHLISAIGNAQFAAVHLPRPGTVVLAGAHLVAAAATRSGTAPSEAEARSIGHAAVCLAFAGNPELGPALEAVVRRRFVTERGRIRSSVYVPRDVEYALGGQVEGLRPAAMLPDRLPALQKLLHEGLRAVLISRAARTAEPGREDALARRARIERAVDAGHVTYRWTDEDLAFVRELAAAATECLTKQA